MVCLLSGCGRKSEFTYKELENGTVCLLKYIGKDTVVTLPAEIDGKTVSATCATFKDNTTVTEVNIPDTVINIEAGTFQNAYNLVSVSGGEGVQTIEWRAFENCSKLQNIPKFSNLREIGSFAFYCCRKLEEITLAEGLEVIGNDIFLGANELEKVVIPESVKEIGVGALDNIGQVKAKVESVVTDEGNVIHCKAIGEEVWIPEGIAYIRNFYHAENVKTVYIPDTVEKVIDMGLQYEDDMTVYIPSTVEYIEEFDSTSDSIVTKLCFVVEAGSYAESFAKKYKVPYEIAEDIQEIYDSTFSACSIKNTQDFNNQIINGNNLPYIQEIQMEAFFRKNVPEIEEYQAYIMEKSNAQAHLIIKVNTELETINQEEEKQYYSVYVGEEWEDHSVNWDWFYIRSDSKEILWYSVVDDIYLSLEEWRNSDYYRHY